MRVIYVGPIDAVDVPLSDGTVVIAPRGEAVEIVDEFAVRLLEQETWQAAKAEKPAKAAKDGE